MAKRTTWRIIEDIPKAQEGLTVDPKRGYTGNKEIDLLIQKYTETQKKINEGASASDVYVQKLRKIADELIDKGFAIEESDVLPNSVLNWKDPKTGEGPAFCIGTACFLTREAGDPFFFTSNTIAQDDARDNPNSTRYLEQSEKYITPGDILQFKQGSDEKSSPHHAYVVYDVGEPNKSGERIVTVVGSKGQGPMLKKTFVLGKDNKVYEHKTWGTENDIKGAIQYATQLLKRKDTDSGLNELIKQRESLKKQINELDPAYFYPEKDVRYKDYKQTAFELTNAAKQNALTTGKVNWYIPEEIDTKESRLAEIVSKYDDPKYKYQYMRSHNISSSEYDTLVSNMMGIYGAETKFGTDYLGKAKGPEWPWLSKLLGDSWAKNHSIGPFQVTYNQLPENYRKGITVGDLYDPVRASEATLESLTDGLTKLRKRSQTTPETATKDNPYSQAITPENYLEYLPYLYNAPGWLSGDIATQQKYGDVLTGESEYKKLVDFYREQVLETIPTFLSTPESVNIAPEKAKGGTVRKSIKDIPKAQNGKPIPGNERVYFPTLPEDMWAQTMIQPYLQKNVRTFANPETGKPIVNLPELTIKPEPSPWEELLRRGDGITQLGFSDPVTIAAGAAAGIPSLGIAGARALMGPISGALNANIANIPGASLNNLINAAGITHSGMQIANPNSALWQSVGAAANDPNANTLSNATYEALLTGLGFAGMPSPSKNVTRFKPKPVSSSLEARSASGLTQSELENWNEGIHRSNLWESLGIADETIQTKGTEILKTLYSPEGVKRLQNLFRQANPDLTENQIHYLVTVRLKEVSDAIAYNQNKFFRAHPEWVQTPDDMQTLYPTYNAHFSHGWNPFGLQEIPASPSLFPPASTTQPGTFNLVKPNPYEGFLDPNFKPGSISLGRWLEKNNVVLDHEVGHAIQKWGATPIDEELRKLVRPSSKFDKIFYNKIIKRDPELPHKLHYFLKGSYGMEPYPFLREQRRRMLERGIIGDIYEPITFGKLLKARYKAFFNNRKEDFSGDRLIKFLPPWKYRKLAEIMNRAPAVIPGTIGAGAAGYLYNQKQDVNTQNGFKQGGQTTWQIID